ncbi:MAG: hypothetical protein JWP97_4206 [Labilithrix sp.]|nr:hypothetical protein [Labilithrix sp.]
MSGRASVASMQIEALLSTLDLAEEPSERAEIFVDIARRFRTELADGGQAIDALLEAWKLDPVLEAVLEELEPLVRAEGRWGELLETTRALAGAEQDPARSLAYSEAMVRWLTGDVPDPDLARQWLERIRQVDSTHWQVHLMQAAASREHGDLKRELDELDLAVLSARRRDDRARIHLTMAARYLDERTANLAEAKRHFTAASKLYPRAMEALRGLELVAQRENDKQALVDVLRRQADADLADDERVAVLLWLAKLEEEELRRPELAAKTLERVLAVVPDHPAALQAFERVLTAARAWSELAVVLERAALHGSDPALRKDRLERLGAVLEEKLGDVRAALATYERIAAQLPEDETVLAELARLAEKVGDVPAAVRYREQLADLAPVPSTRARMLVIAGQLLVPLDAASARRQFERAAAADPGNQAAWNALLWDARADGDVPRALRYLEERARGTSAPRARGAAYVELADARAKAGDEAGARDAYEQAAAADPANEAAAVALVPLLVDAERFAEAEQLCDVAVAAAERDKDHDQLVLLRRAQARAAEALGKPERALAAMLAAYQVRPRSPDVREELVEMALPMRADPRILTARDALLAIAEQPDGLCLHGRAGLAEVLALTGEGERAAELYRSVLDEDPAHEGALAGLSRHHVAAGNAGAALGLRRQLAESVADPDERFAALIVVAEAAARLPESEAFAAEVYELARQVRPRDLPTLHKLLALYPKQQKWASLFDVLRAIAEVDGDPRRRAKTLITMAQLAAAELGDRQAAVRHYELALDADAAQLAAFENIVRLLTQDRDWTGLARSYERMIRRTSERPGGDPVLLRALHKQIGLVHRDRLKDSERALAAYQAAVKLDPKDEQAQVILRELLAHTGQSQGAVAVTLARVLHDPLDPAPYPALFDLLEAQGDRDRALRAASAMAFLGITHAGARALRASHPPPSLEAVPQDLGFEGFRDVLHQDLDPQVTEIFEAAAPAMIDLVLSRLSIRERLGHPGPALEGHPWLPVAVTRAATILGAPPPRLHGRREPGPALTAAPTRPPSLVAHPPALGGIGADVIAFLIGKRLLEISPPLVARALCPSLTELKALAQSAARIATDQTEPGDQALRGHLDRAATLRVQAAVQASRAAGGKLDVLTWSRRADVSACRAGLLLAGDLEAARSGIALEAQSPTDLTPREKMKELLGWFLGDECGALRRRLGVAL